MFSKFNYSNKFNNHTTLGIEDILRFQLVSNIFEFSGNAPLKVLHFKCHVTKR